MSIEVISEEEAQEEFDKITRKGKWSELLDSIKKDGEPRKVTKLTRGQIAALYRTAKDSGVEVRTSYKEGFVILRKASEPVVE